MFVCERGWSASRAFRVREPQMQYSLLSLLLCDETHKLKKAWLIFCLQVWCLSLFTMHASLYLAPSPIRYTTHTTAGTERTALYDTHLE